MEKFNERLRTCIKASGGNKVVAEKSNVKLSTLNTYIKGIAEPNVSKLMAIASTCGVSTDWLIYGQEGHKSVTINDDFALVPQLNIEASAGLGFENGQHEVVENHIAFKKEWLKRHDINPAFASAITVTGDSMDPTIRNGDTLLIDTSIKEIRDNGIYIVVVNGMTMVKRVHIKLNRSITLISDNLNYPDEEIIFDETHQLHIAGRVMWFGRGI
ncbi:MAG: helix-turn-helix transcriptional regulator [Rhizobiales bacterium]|nr:helix-turn-helix transcriptional regulator [Hyphomicrobiales bacterium]